MTKILKFISRSQTETLSIAKLMSQVFETGDVIILEGDLGTGKTHFVQGVLSRFSEEEEATSPTFNIANFYETEQMPVLHLDLYRIESSEEFEELGLTEYFDHNMVFVEWGEKFRESLDADFLLRLKRTTTENERKFALQALTPQAEDKMEQIKIKISEYL